jgi:hypothetical protein
MAPTRSASKPRATLEDPLDYLPCSPIAQYRKHQVIYNQNEPSTSIYLILEGKVKVSRLAEGGRQVLVNIYQTTSSSVNRRYCTFLYGPKAPRRWKIAN